MNAAMRRLLTGERPEVALAPRLREILDGGFVERDGCVFLAKATRSVHDGEALDPTGLEALANHVHVEDLLEGEGDVVAQAHRYAVELGDALAGTFPGVPLEVVMSVSDSCVVRFYRRRPGRPWLAEDLEGYEDEAVLVLRPG